MDGQTKQDVDFGVVRARRVEIVGADGSLRVELGTSDRGDAVVRLRDSSGVVRALVSIQDDKPRVRLLDRAGQVRLCGILREDQPGLELLGSDGNPRLVMYLRGHEDEAPDLYFVDHDGDARFGVAMDRDGRITLASVDEAGLLKDVAWTRTQNDDEAEPLF